MTDSAIKNMLQQAGYSTTVLGKNEASFEDYGYALGDNVKDMITSSFDSDADYELQSKIATAFGKRSCIQSGDFVNTLRNMGLTVSSKYVNTQYMEDEKAVGHGSRKVINGAIDVYTISDGKGGEIVIADANGNAALEIEEVFMNQILNDIAVDVNKLKTQAGATSGDVSANTGNAVKSTADAESAQPKDKENSEKEDQDKFNERVELYYAGGFSIEEAEKKANIDLNTKEMTYTGTLREEDDEIENEEYFQENFNSEVENYVKNSGYSLEDAVFFANMLFGTSNMDYTGIMAEELKERQKK